MLVETDNLQLVLAILTAWNLKLEPEDLKLIADTQILFILQRFINKYGSNLVKNTGKIFVLSNHITAFTPQNDMKKSLFRFVDITPFIGYANCPVIFFASQCDHRQVHVRDPFCRTPMVFG